MPKEFKVPLDPQASKGRLDLTEPLARLVRRVSKGLPDTLDLRVLLDPTVPKERLVLASRVRPVSRESRVPLARLALKEPLELAYRVLLDLLELTVLLVFKELRDLALPVLEPPAPRVLRVSKELKELLDSVSKVRRVQASKAPQAQPAFKVLPDLPALPAKVLLAA